MFLKSLEIRGFKSFADKTNLKFKQGVTAVVGPNGSGKSNISDAVRWVLGEQSIKTLRGGKMEDVIFAGTQFRKPVGLAQVSLTLDNSDDSLDTDYNEVTITRRIFRSGESEYLINNQKCRLKDINQLFMDTGIGKEGYSLIGQGKIEAILSGKPEERRNLLEEAAGIVKYKSRKDEAEKKLSNTEENLVRIRDILSTYEERIEPLKVDREKALKYQELAQELREKEVSLLVKFIKNIEEELTLKIKEVTEVQRELDSKNNKLSLLKEKLRDYENKLEELENKNNEEKNEFYSKKEEVSKCENEIVVFKERILNIKELIKSSMEDIQYNQNSLKVLEEEKERLTKELESKLNEKNKKDNDVALIENDINKLNNNIRAFEDELSALRDDEFGIHEKASEINNTIKILKRDIETNQGNSVILKRNIETTEDNISINTATIAELRKKFILSKESKVSLIETLEQTKSEYISNQGKLKKIEKDLNNLFATLNKQEANHSMLSDLEKHYEGYNRAVKMLMEKISKGNIPYAVGTKVLGEIFTVDKKYEVAIEIALGGAISNIITKDEIVSKNLINFLKSNKLGRATFLPLNIIKGNKLNVPQSIVSIDGYLGLASENVDFENEYKNILEYSLGRTIIAKDMDSALNIAKVGNYKYKIVTLTGEVVNPGGALTGGSLVSKSTNLLGRKREIEELALSISENKKRKEVFIQEKERLIKNIAALDEQGLNIREEIHSVEVDIKGIEAEINSLVNEAHKLKNSLLVSKNELTHLENLIKKNKDSILEYEKKVEAIEKENKTNKARVSELETIILNAKKESDNNKEKLTELKINKATLDEIVSSKRIDIKRKEQDIQEKTNKINKLNQEIILKQEGIVNLDSQIKEKDNTIKLLLERITELEEIFKEDEIKKIQVKENCKNYESKINNELDLIRRDELELNKKEVQNAKLENEKENLYKRLNEELELTLAEAKEIATDIDDIQSYRESIYRLKNKITLLGTVNLAAIAEYEEVSQKYEFMSRQEADLQGAKLEIEEVIAQMTLKMQDQFRDNFKILNKNFNETFKELFKGGTAELILSNGDELTANIDINVQPPGKKLQNINLMSGGEKVLSAIALLFAILKMKPTPFCILDEIEAALDDANVHRYAEFLKEFSEKVQFIVITHRKGTMEASDIMYGVTMEEKGISKVVSVDLTQNI